MEERKRYIPDESKFPERFKRRPRMEEVHRRVCEELGLPVIPDEELEPIIERARKKGFLNWPDEKQP